MCLFRFSSLGSCQYGSLCTQAHSIDELAEWGERFVAKKNHLKHAQEEGTCQRYELAEAILEKLMSTEDPETVVSCDHLYTDRNRCTLCRDSVMKYE